MSKQALIITAKDVASAPRVLREIQTLSQNGWAVDTIGFGGKPVGARSHKAVPQVGTLERYLSYLLPAHRLRFEMTLGRRFKFLDRSLTSHYQLVIFHEPTLFPLRGFLALTQSLGNRVHIDLHENHLDTLSRTPIEEMIFGSYRRWEFTHLDRFVQQENSKTTYSSCSDSIAKLYAKRWNRVVHTIRNAPAYKKLLPSQVEEPIKLVHHGVATRDRFHFEYIKAISASKGSFELHFFLLGGTKHIRKLVRFSKNLGVSNRVFFHSPVPTQDIAQEINRYDVGLVVIPPVTRNEELALPNKLFESAQARLALVSGPNPDMADLLRKWGNGVVLEDWSVEALVDSLEEMEPKQVEGMKFRSNDAARELSSDSDSETILRVMTNWPEGRACPPRSSKINRSS